MDSKHTLCDALPELLSNIADCGSRVLRGNVSKDRRELLNLGKSLVNQLQDPHTDLLWLAWAEPTRQAAIQTAINLNLFDSLQRESTLQDLANATGASAPLLRRLLRHLAATHVVREVAPEVYAPSPLSSLLCDPRHAAALTYRSLLSGPVLARLPYYLEESEYVEPGDHLHGPFQFAMATTLSPWKWARQRKDLANVFALHMSGYHVGQKAWFDRDFYPFGDRLLVDASKDPSDVFMVDVGGALSHDLMLLKETMSDALNGKRLILQDTEIMVRGARRPGRPIICIQMHPDA